MGLNLTGLTNQDVQSINSKCHKDPQTVLLRPIYPQQILGHGLLLQVDMRIDQERISRTGQVLLREHIHWNLHRFSNMLQAMCTHQAWVGSRIQQVAYPSIAGEYCLIEGSMLVLCMYSNSSSRIEKSL